MFLIASETTAQLDGAIRAQARLVKDQRIETFDIGLWGTTLREIENVVDTLDGQIGTVLCLFTVDADGKRDRTLYKSMFESWDLGVIS